MGYEPTTYCGKCREPADVYQPGFWLCEACKDLKMERAELGVDGNAGFVLLGDDLQSGEAEFVVIDMPSEASKDPNRYHKSEWLDAAKRASSAAYRTVKQRLADRKFSYYLGKSHPDYLG